MNPERGNGKDLRTLSMREDQRSCLWLTKIVGAIACFITLILGLILAVGWPGTFDLQLFMSVEYRDGNDLTTDFFPFMVSRVIGTASLGTLASILPLLALLGFLVSLLFHQSEVDQINTGVNPYVWIFFALWHPSLFLLLAWVAGVSNIWLSISIFTLVLSWVFLFWLSDLLNSPAYKMALRKAVAAGFDGFGWVQLLMIFVIIAVTYTIIFAHLWATFSSTVSPSGSLLAIPITIGFIYLAHPAIYFANYMGLTITSAYLRTIVYYVANIILVILATLLPIFIFSGDGIVSPGTAETSSAGTLSPLVALGVTAVATLFNN